MLAVGIPARSHADDVHADDEVDALLNDERRNILRAAGASAEQAQPADTHKLMHGRITGQEDIVLQHAVAADEGAVGQKTVVADDTIVSDVGIGHEEVVVADTGRPGGRRAAMDRDPLAEDVVVADLESRRFPRILDVLRLFAEGSVTVNLIPKAHRQRAEQVRTRPYDTTGPEADLTFDHDICANLHVVG